KIRFETWASFAVQRLLHRIVPEWSVQRTAPKVVRIQYRSYEDGSMEATMVKDYRIPAANVAQRLTLTDREIDNARRFHTEIANRGGRLVLINIPPGPEGLVRDLAGVLGVPYLSTEVPGLVTCDGSHLSPDSAARFSEALLGDFARLLA